MKKLFTILSLLACQSFANDYVRAMIPTNVGAVVKDTCVSNTCAALGNHDNWIVDAKVTNGTGIFWVVSIDLSQVHITEPILRSTLDTLGYTNVLTLYCPNNQAPGWTSVGVQMHP